LESEEDDDRKKGLTFGRKSGRIGVMILGFVFYNSLMFAPYAILVGLYAITLIYALRRMWRFHTEGDATLFMSWTFGIISTVIFLISVFLLLSIGNFNQIFKV